METKHPISFYKKLIYGAGDWGEASYGTLRQIFYAIFLTDVVGLESRVASIVVLIGIIWDAINDPLVGMLSDRLRSRWGSSRPLILLFSIPFGLSFLLLWWAPPWQDQAALAVTITLAFLISDTLETLVGVPFSAMLPNLAPEYDQRTTLTSYRIFFNLLASLITAVTAPAIVDVTLASGFTQQQGYLLVAGLFGGLAAIPFILIGILIKDKSPNPTNTWKRVSLGGAIRAAWSNVPFRFAASIFMVNWVTFDLVALLLPFYLQYWIASGNLVSSVSLFGLILPTESGVFATLLITSVVVLPFWLWLSRKTGKHIAYCLGMVFWAVIQFFIFFVPQGKYSLVLWIAFLAGISVSAAHILPDAIFPDVIEWSEITTGQRNEGIYYGIKNFIRKGAGALASFMALQVLGWSGYKAPPAGITIFQQSETTLLAIKILIGPVGAFLLLLVVAITYFYPITRDRHERMMALLKRRQVMHEKLQK